MGDISGVHDTARPRLQYIFDTPSKGVHLARVSNHS
jgi:hypothetical protein